MKIVPRTQSKRPKMDSMEKTKVKLAKLESIFQQVESSEEAKYTSLTDAIYAAIRV